MQKNLLAIIFIVMNGLLLIAGYNYFKNQNKPEAETVKLFDPAEKHVDLELTSLKDALAENKQELDAIWYEQNKEIESQKKEIENLKKQLQALSEKIVLLGTIHNENVFVNKNSKDHSNLVYLKADWTLNQALKYVKPSSEVEKFLPQK